MSNQIFSEKEFNRQFNETTKLVKRGFAAVIVVWLIGACLSLGLMGTIIYVAWHFISKYW